MGSLRWTAVLLMLSILVPATAAAESAGSQSRSLQSGLIDAGDSHACAALVTQQLRCWGSISFGKLGIGLGEDDGELGIGDDELPTDIAPVDLGAGRSAREISIGAKTACVILDDGSVRCWGDNQSGQAGYGNSMVAGKGILGDTPDELPALLGPVDLGPGRTAKAISVGESHVCAILDTGDLRCWGQSNVGQLGLGTSYSGGVGDNETPGSVPLLDLGGKKALAITAGGFHTCALLDDHKVYCWGDNSFTGAIGTGAGNVSYGLNNPPLTAGHVDFDTPNDTAVAISASGDHTCAVLTDGTLRCWGWGFYGELGYPGEDKIGDDETPEAFGPISIGVDRKVVDLNVGYDNTCIVMDDGLVRCWGDGADFINVQPGGGGPPQDVGDGEHPSTAPTINLGGLATVVTVGGQNSAGGNHACALLTTGGVRCWGGSINQFGQLGLGGDTDPDTAGDQPGGWIGDQPGENPSVFDPISLGASLPTTVADLSLSAALSDTSVTTGETTTLTYSLRNDGPAASAGTAAKMYLPVVSATNAVASAGSFNAGTGVWTVGTLAANTTATLEFTVAAATAASYGLGGEVSAASTIDPDSTPGNARAVEDDQDTATLVVSAAPGGPNPNNPNPNNANPSTPIALSAEARKLTAKMAVTRTRVRGGRLNLIGSISTQATGRVQVSYAAAGKTVRFRQAIVKGRVRVNRRLPRRMRRATTGIVTLSYGGNSRVRKDSLKLRAGTRKGSLRRTASRIAAGRLQVSGRISKRARGKVRVRLEYVSAAGELSRKFFNATISRTGRWRVSVPIDAAQRAGGQLAIQFTGYRRAKLWGEQLTRAVKP